jgi:hypothetical protein
MTAPPRYHGGAVIVFRVQTVDFADGMRYGD